MNAILLLVFIMTVAPAFLFYRHRADEAAKKAKVAEKKYLRERRKLDVQLKIQQKVHYR